LAVQLDEFFLQVIKIIKGKTPRAALLSERQEANFGTR